MKIIEFFKKNPSAILLTAIIILFWPMIFGKKLFPGFDLLLVFYPYSFHFLHSQSFWASGILSGFNIGATPSAFAGNWIYYFLAHRVGAEFFNFITFYNFIIFFYFILTVIFSYLAARILNFDKWISVLIASVYIFSAYNLSWMVNIVTAASLFVFPAIIYFLLKFSPSGRSSVGGKNTQNWLWPALGGLILGLSLITSHPQFALIGVFGGFLFSLFLVFGSGAKPKWIFLVAFLVMCLIGLALASFQLLPEYQLNKLTQRGAALSFQDSQECALGILDFIRYLIPNFNFGVGCESLLYVGILPLIFAIFAVVYMKKDMHVIFWSLLLAFALLFSIKYSPLAWVFHQLPIWSGLRGPARFVMLGNFALAVLSGYGFNWILESKESFKKSAIFWWIKKIFLGFISVIIVINVLSLFKDTFIRWAQAFFDKYYYAKTIGLPLEHYHRAIENLISGNFYTFGFLNKDFAIPLILTISAFLIIIFIYKFNKTALFYVVLLSGFTWAISSPMVSSGLSRDFFDETSVINFLKSQKGGPFRVYSLMPNLSTYQLLVLNNSGVSDADQNEFFKTMIPSNLYLVYGFDSIDGYDVSMPRRTARLLSEILSERATLGNKIAEVRLKPEEKIKIFESRTNLISMMNVKYVISAYPINEKILKKVFESKVTRFKIPIYIYENKNILPRFYVVNKAEFVATDEIKSLEKILVSNFDFRTVTLIECEKFQDCSQIANKGEITDSEYKDGYLKLKTKFDASGWVVFSESFSPFWQAKINNEPVSIYRANYVYQAIKVPAGNNLIEFEYKPEFFKK